MNEVQRVEADIRRVDRPDSALPAWWLVFTKELNGLWIGGRALILILIFSVLMGIITYVMASNSELSLIPPKEMVFELLKIAIAASGFICLIIGADMISGERERATLEWLLLVPASRRQIIFGKFLATVSPWPAALLITIPYLYLASQGDEALSQAVLWSAILGSLLALSLSALGMLISVWCNSNKTSYFVSMGIFLLVIVPTQLPGSAQTGAMGKLLKKISPMESIYHFLEKIIVNNRSLEELAVFLIAPVVLTIITFGLLIGFAKRGLRLEIRHESKLWSSIGHTAGLLFIAILLIAALGTFPARAYQGEVLTDNVLPIEISIDKEAAVVNAGDPVLYESQVTNVGSEESPDLIVAMNIINLDSEGDVVDPEDWSPERTQYLEPLAPGESEALSWRINAILAGDYMVYMVLVPQPESQQATSHPITSSGIHLTVNEFTRVDPLGVLPFVIGAPIVLLIVIYVIFRARRRAVD